MRNQATFPCAGVGLLALLVGCAAPSPRTDSDSYSERARAIRQAEPATLARAATTRWNRPCAASPSSASLTRARLAASLWGSRLDRALCSRRPSERPERTGAGGA